MAKGKKNTAVWKLLEQQKKRERLTSSTAERLRNPYSFGNSGISSMADEMSRVREQFISPISSIQQMLDSFHEPVRAFQALIPNVQAWVNPYQPVIDSINNSGLTSLLKSFSEVYEPITTMKAFQNNFVFPDFRVHTELWENILDDDVDLQEATSILDDVKEEKQTLEEAVEKLTFLVEGLVSKPTTNEVSSFSRFEKISILYMIITTLLMTLPLILPNNADNTNNEKVITKLTVLGEILTEKHKETTANLRLRTEPTTSNPKNILLIIPKGSVVMVNQSISYWSNIMYTDEEGFVRSGWVSKRYLEKVN